MNSHFARTVCPSCRLADLRMFRTADGALVLKCDGLCGPGEILSNLTINESAETVSPKDNVIEFKPRDTTGGIS